MEPQFSLILLFVLIPESLKNPFTRQREFKGLGGPEDCQAPSPIY